MNSNSGNDLVPFVVRYLETRGAVLEQKEDGWEALLPETVSDLLGTPEYVHLHDQTENENNRGYGLYYGSPLVDKMVEETCGQVPLLVCQLEFDYLKSGGFDRLIKDSFHFHGASGNIQSTANVKTEYLILTCRYTAQSDEQKEGLITLAFNFETGAFIPHMVDSLPRAEKNFRAEIKIRRDEKRFKEILKQVQVRAKEIIVGDIAPFRESMIRRFKRDAHNLAEYFEAMEKEMKASLERQGLSEELIKDRQEKIAALPLELERKKDDLFKKYSIKIRVIPCAMMMIRTPAVKILCRLTKPGQNRTLSLIYNPVTRSIDPYACQGCGTGTIDIFSCPKFHLLCTVCRTKCPLCG